MNSPELGIDRMSDSGARSPPISIRWRRNHGMTGGLPICQVAGMDDVDPIALTFPQRVAMVVARIPGGRVTTYGRIARALGAPRSARMVGWAIGRLPDGHELPAHRVVNHVGFLSGAKAFGDPYIMRDLLLEEGTPFRAEWVVALEECLWDPADDPLLDNLFRVGLEQ